NGAPFTAYPALFKLLMSREARREAMENLNPQALKHTTLASLDREYSLEEVAIMTRAAPSKLLGLADRGHLGDGAVADVAVYRRDEDAERMFGAAELVFKNGELVVRQGEVVSLRPGKTLRV